MGSRALASLVNFLGKAALLCFVHLATASESGLKHSTSPFITSTSRLNEKQTLYYYMN